MKSGLAAFTQAVKDTQNFDGMLSLLLTSDEEGDAKYGTVIMLEHLKKISDRDLVMDLPDAIHVPSNVTGKNTNSIFN